MSTKLKIGDVAPDFTLQGVDGNNHSLKTLLDAKRAVVVLFTCNHCPYVRAYEDRIMALQAEFVRKDVSILCINSNDATTHPADSFEAMKDHAGLKMFNFPYLRDETQIVAKAFGAEYTPEAFVFDHEGRLRYNGRIDDNWKDEAAVKDHTLREAIRAVLDGQLPAFPTTHAIGCTIKWTPA
jgi:peroxiredoxin